MGGANESLHLMAERISKRGNRVAVLTFNSSMNNLPKDPSYNLIEPEEEHLGTRVGVNYRVFQLLKKYEDEFDIFHIFRPITLPGAGIYKTKGGTTPVVGRLNSYTMFCTNMNEMRGDCYKRCNTTAKFNHSPKPLSKKLAKIPSYFSRTVLEPQYVNHIDQFFAISPAAKDVYQSIGLNEDSIDIIPNFYNPNFVNNNCNPANISPNRPLKLMFVGRVIPLKGLSTLIEAVYQVPERITLDVVGDGSQLSEIKKLTSSLNLDEDVEFQGWTQREELPKYFQSADLVVHPARLPEPFGRSVLEALQCNTPVVAADHGAPPWIIGSAGKTFEPESTEDLSRVISDLAQNRGEIEKLRSNCETELNRFEVDKCVNKVIDKYTALC
jgi:glycosyltransferase involved in cell wall biosynthesis